MNVMMQSFLVTNGQEKRLDGNRFRFVQTGYAMYPIETIMDLKRTEEQTPVAKIIIEAIHWEKGETTIMYQVISLNSVN